jgi:hypothetical protein
MDYIKLYEAETKRKVKKGYDIHHIDKNRNNNSILNLVALPKELHQKYHKNQFSNPTLHNRIYYNLLGSLEPGNAFNEYFLEQFSEFVLIFNECKKYIDYRDYLLGRIPNIHNFNI